MQSVIVYRNPLEQMFWESGAPYYIAIIIFGLLIGLAIADCYNNWKRNRKR